MLELILFLTNKIAEDSLTQCLLTVHMVHFCLRFSSFIDVISFLLHDITTNCSYADFTNVGLIKALYCLLIRGAGDCSPNSSIMQARMAISAPILRPMGRT